MSHSTSFRLNADWSSIAHSTGGIAYATAYNGYIYTLYTSTTTTGWTRLFYTAYNTISQLAIASYGAAVYGATPIGVLYSTTSGNYA